MNTQATSKHNLKIKHNQKTEKSPKEGQETLQTKARDQPTAAAMSRRHGSGPHKDDEEKEF